MRSSCAISAIRPEGRTRWLTSTPYDDLPPAAVSRLGIAPGQHNLLVRITLRALDRTLTHAECNALRDDIYAALHAGAVYQWANRRPGSSTSGPAASASRRS